MALPIRVTGGKTIISKVVTGNPIRRVTGGKTIISKVVTGNPIRRVTGGGFDINSMGGVDTTDKVDGAMLVYNATTENFEATEKLDNQNTNINGGNY